MTGSDETSVRVAVRVRPQSSKEKSQMNGICTSVNFENKQILLGKDRIFTYDYVFNQQSSQDDLFTQVSKPLIDGCLQGYNATLLAYGQTGSGKTYSMGTGIESDFSYKHVGIIPRAVEYLFHKMSIMNQDAIKQGQVPPTFKVMAQFLELYNEELHDLLDMDRRKIGSSQIRIHENAQGEIYMTNVSNRVVSSLNDTINCLKDGALYRTTASTHMNAQSSRSHAIFTLVIKQTRIVPPSNEAGDEETEKDMDTCENNTATDEVETLSAKFHFVDLAGSERLKRTGATGDRAKEGISINCGLLALGNVISALGDRNKKGWHVPYRDSKLTRLLQDSLGGNSRTIMIACVSPSDCDILETLNTLQYANRARNIKNKITVNQDLASKQLSALRAQITQLQDELMEYKTGRRQLNADGTESFSDLYTETNFLQIENEKLRLRVKALSDCVEGLRNRNAQLLADFELAQYAASGGENKNNQLTADATQLVMKLTAEIESLRSQLGESSAMLSAMERDRARIPLKPANQSKPLSFRSVNADGDSAMEGLDSGRSGGIVKESNKNSDWSTDGEDSPSGDEENRIVESEILENMASLDTKIDEREQLVQELRVKSQQLDRLRRHYEQQLLLLNNRIKSTETERDEVLANINVVEHDKEEKVKKVKHEYETKIRNLQDELRKVSEDSKEHNRRLKEQARVEAERDRLMRELEDLKKMKVELARKLREESKRNRETEMLHTREIAALKRKRAVDMNTIRNLEQEKKRREFVLQKRQAEVDALKKRQDLTRPGTAASLASGGVGTATTTRITRVVRLRQPIRNGTTTAPATTNNIRGLPNRRRESVLARVAKGKWDQLEQAMKNVVRRRLIQSRYNRDLNNWMREREKLGRRIESLLKKRDKIVKKQSECIDSSTLPPLSSSLNEIDFKLRNLTAQLESAQEQISECQTSIVDMGEETSMDSTFATIFGECSFEEAQYLLNRLLEEAIQKFVISEEKAQSEGLLRQQLSAKSKEKEQALEMLKIAVTRPPTQFKLDVEAMFTRSNENSDEDDNNNQDDDDDDEDDGDDDDDDEDQENDESRSSNEFLPLLQSSVSENESQKINALLPPPAPASSRRVFTSPEELLGTFEASSTLAAASKATNLSTIAEVDQVNNSGTMSARMTLSMDESMLNETSTAPQSHEAQVIVSQSAQTLKRSVPLFRLQSSTSVGGSRQRTITPIQSQQQQQPSLMTQSLYGVDSSSFVTPPISPKVKHSITRRPPNGAGGGGGGGGVQDDVFNRLASICGSPQPNKGEIVQCNRSSVNTPLSRSKSPLECAFIAEGHAKAVLDVCLSESIMLSGSKDRTAKVWDLTKLVEVTTLSGHSNNVVKVHYAPSLRSYFTTCAYFVYVWDERESRKPVITLLSSGLTEVEGESFGRNMPTRKSTFPSSEVQVNDIQIDPNNHCLFMATGMAVRVWDLRQNISFAKLHGNHQAPITALACDRNPSDPNQLRLITGSKDHYMKMFSFTDSITGVITPNAELRPPHYDGIESLVLSGNLLFSGSRDACIKKWDLSSTPRVLCSIPQAHRDWIQSLCLTPDGLNLFSACRAGVLKMWNVEDGANLGEITVSNSAINAVRSHSSFVATASNDHVVRLWPTPIADVQL